MNKLWVSMISMLFTAAGTMPALAQTGDAGYELEEVVVTAELREVNLQKVATSIQVTSGEELRKEGKKRIDEIMAGAVGIQTQDSQNGVTFFVRGVDSGGAGGVVSTPVLVDGVAQSRAEAVRGGTLDLARAEVMRGPQSTTLGANALSGAVSLVSNKPVFNYEASTSLDIGNYHNVTMEGVMNVPLADNQAVRIAYSSQKRDSYYSNGAGDSDLTNARLKYRWQPSNTLDMTATVSHQNIGGNGVNQLTLLTYGRYVPWRNGPASQPGSTLYDHSVCQKTTVDVTIVDCATPGAVIQQQNSLVNLGATGVIGASQLSLPGGPLLNAAGKPMIQNTLGGIPEFLGYPVQYLPVNDGTNFRTRQNAWDDGSNYNAWSNNPYRNSNIEQASVELNWTTDLGTVTFLPSYQSTHFTSLEPYRGGQAMGANNYQRTKIGDLRMNSPSGDKLVWQTGLYYSDDRQSQMSSFVNLPGVGMAAAGMAGNAADPTGQGSVGDPGQCNLGVGTTSNLTGQVTTVASNGSPYGLNADGTPTTYVAGVPYAALLTTSPCYNYTYQPKLDRLNKAIYFNTEYSVLDTVRLLAGARYNDQTGRQLTYNLINGDQNGPFATCPLDTTGKNITVCNGNILPSDPKYPQFRALDNLSVATNFATRWTHTTYRAGVEWDVLPETMLYGVYSTGFNPGAFDAMQNTVNPAVTLEQTTVGWKSQAMDNRLQFNGEAFLTEYQNRAIDGNVIAYYGDADSTNCTVAMGATALASPTVGTGYCMGLGTGLVKNFKSKGLDLDMTWLITAVDRLSLTAEYLDAHYDEAPYFRPIAANALSGTVACQSSSTIPPVYNADGTVNPVYLQTAALCGGMNAGGTPTLDEFTALAKGIDQQSQGFIGTSLQNAPKFSATWNYSHNFLLANGSRLTPRISGAYKTRYWSLGGGGPGNAGVNVIANAGTDRSSPYYLAWQQAYATWDGSIAWDKADGKFTVTGYVKNLTNEVVLSGFTYQYVSIAAPRTWGATFVANF